jgi:2-methylcitrate dehydratase PrpD
MSIPAAIRAIVSAPFWQSTRPRDPLGHPNKPMGDEEVSNKFLRTVEPVYGKDKTKEVSERWWKVSELSESELVLAIDALDV